MKKSLEMKIKETIARNDSFCLYDFEIIDKFTEKKIEYNYSDKNFSFSFRLPNEISKVRNEDFNYLTGKKEIVVRELYEFSGVMSPGRYTDSENFKVDSFDKFLEKITEWLYCLNEELIGDHLHRQLKIRDEKIETLKNSINEHFNKYEIEDKDNYLTHEEAEELFSRLNELEQLIEKRLREDLNEKEELKAEIDKLHEEFENFRKATSYMSKQNWFKKFMISTISWSFEPSNQKKLKAGSSLLFKIGKIAGLPVPEQLSTLLLDSEKAE